MRKLRSAAVVAVMVGSVGMLGAGMASADDWQKPGLNIFNPQSLNCIYSGNTATAPVNTATTGTGNANASQILGNICPQTGPVVGG